MKKFLYFLLLSSIILMFSGCTGKQTPVSANLGEEFTIRIGQCVEIGEEDLTITFSKIIGDSRCPKEVQCIWAGVVDCEMTIAYQDKTYSLVLKQPGLSEQAEDVFFDYKLTFNITPYPVAGEEIDAEDYRLTMTVTQ